MSKVDTNEIEKQLDKLIESGIIKDIYEIEGMRIDAIPRVTGICVKDLLCYLCQKKASNKKCDKCHE